MKSPAAHHVSLWAGGIYRHKRDGERVPVVFRTEIKMPNGLDIEYLVTEKLPKLIEKHAHVFRDR